MIDLLINDRNVMVLGEAGTGKSALIEAACSMYIDRRRREGKQRLGILVTAPCGMPASKLRGQTLDSVFPQLTNMSDPRTCANVIKKMIAVNPDRWNFIRLLCLLVIDEISTLLVNKLKMLDIAFRIIRDAPSDYMGGVRVMLCGDFLQLDSAGDVDGTKLYGHEMMIEGQFKVFNLTRNVRQTDDNFAGLLSRARLGRLTEADGSLLRSRNANTDQENDIASDTLQICGTRNLAHIINIKRFESLKGTSRTYEFPAIKRWKMSTEGEDDWVVKPLDTENPSELGSLGEKLRDLCARPCVKDAKRCTLRIGARVMLNRNLYEYKDCRMRNGRVGTVVDVCVLAEQYDEETLLSPLTYVGVRFDDDATEDTVRVKPAVLRHGTVEVWCMPLIHAWAVTVNKAQGCEVDKTV
ncbi:hypothetical protein CYMTET_38225, partial [Cymbomonas tetramitiformis]